MGGEWIRLPANEFCDSVRDGTHDSPKPVDKNGRRLVTSKHITGNRLDLANAYLISEEDYTEINKRSRVDRWDVLITMIGTVGEACLVAEPPDFAIKNIGLFKSKGELEGKYLYYYLSTPEAKQHIAARLCGTTQQYIPLGELRNFPICFPASRNEMGGIVSILASLDDKIELNRQLNATLESMAQALFKSWFVDFDPVIDNALAAGNPIPEPLQARAEARAALGDQRRPLPETIRQRFPNSFIFTQEMGWVPEGWVGKPIGHIIELAYGKSLPAAMRVAGDVPVYGSGGLTGFHNQALVDGPGIVVGRKGTVGSLYWIEENFFPIDTVFYVVNKSYLPLYWVFQLLGLLDIESMGADSAVPGVNRNSVYSKMVVVPSEPALDGYRTQIEVINLQRQTLIDQLFSLSGLRDILLPKLLSGQLRIPDAETIVKAV